MEKKWKTNLITWSVLLGIPLSFLAWGMLVFFVTGVKWPPPWDYGAIQDVPGQSPYSVSEAKNYLGYESRPLQAPGEVARQHVMGMKGEPPLEFDEKAPFNPED